MRPRVLLLTLALVVLASCHRMEMVDEPPLAPLNPSAVRVDLDVDTDRDGVVDDSLDEAGEDAWTSERGAMFMVNLDNDDGSRDGRPDAIDFDVSGAPVSEDFTIGRFARRPGHDRARGPHRGSRARARRVGGA